VGMAGLFPPILAVIVNRHILIDRITDLDVQGTGLRIDGDNRAYTVQRFAFRNVTMTEISQRSPQSFYNYGVHVLTWVRLLQQIDKG
jgi:hypothetical protein